MRSNPCFPNDPSQHPFPFPIPEPRIRTNGRFESDRPRNLGGSLERKSEIRLRASRKGRRRRDPWYPSLSPRFFSSLPSRSWNEDEGMRFIVQGALSSTRKDLRTPGWRNEREAFSRSANVLAPREILRVDPRVRREDIASEADAPSRCRDRHRRGNVDRKETDRTDA